MDSSPPSSSFRLSNLYNGESDLQYDLKKQSITSMKMKSYSPCNSPANDENVSPQASPQTQTSPQAKDQLSPMSNVLKAISVPPSPHPTKKSNPQSPAPAGCFQLELEKQSSLFQLNYAEERHNQLMQKNVSLQAAVGAAEAHSDKLEKELSAAKQEIVALQFDKNNLSNEVRKLSRSVAVSTPMDSSISGSGGGGTGVSVWGQMTAASRELTRIEDELSASRRDLNELREENELLSRQAEKFMVKEEAHSVTVQELLLEKKKSEEMAESLAALMKEKSLLTTQLDNQERLLKKEINSRDVFVDSLRLQMAAKERDIELLFSEKEFLEGKVEALKSFGGSRESDISSLTAGTLVSEDNSSKRKRDENEDGEGAYNETAERLEEYKSKLLMSENKRRRLLNELQELRGNVRVFVRCRPFLSGDYSSNGNGTGRGEEGSDDLKKCINCNVEGTTVSVATDMTLRNAGQVFQFDKVFDDSAQQETVFSEVSDLVQSALDGFRVCIFSYGQTGSGKTHTMSGAPSGKERGLISRSVEQIIDRIQFMRGSGWVVKATYSMLEVYNETLIDLLGTGDKGAGKLQISMQSERVVVKNLTEEAMCADSVDEGLQQLEEVMKRANSMRSTASTAMNAASSRSHALFMMNIEARHEDGTCVQGGLRLVDLAGSERLARTGTQGVAARLKETVNINKSLSCLGDVFLGLSKKSTHIPYRNSKLTMLLQDCLGGNGKTLMFVNISPTIESGQETICSLKFASQVNQVQLGAARKGVTIMQQQQSQPMPPMPPPPQHQQQQHLAVECFVKDSPKANLHSYPPQAHRGHLRAHTAPSHSTNTLPIHSPIKRKPPIHSHSQHSHSSQRVLTSSSPAHKSSAPRRVASAVSSSTASASATSLAKTRPKKGNGGGWR